MVSVAPAHAATCSSGYICLYPQTQYRGTPLSFRACTFVDIGRMWGHNRIRSIINNQSSGTVSNFYNWYASESRWQYVGYSRAKASHPTVSAGVASAEGVQVC